MFSFSDNERSWTFTLGAADILKLAYLCAE
jgi:hypothetical protein